MRAGVRPTYGPYVLGLALGIGLFLVWLATWAHADPATHALPDQTRQRQVWQGDTVRGEGWIAPSCSPQLPSSSLTIAAFACEGYVRDTTTGELLYVSQASHALGPLSGGTGTYWLGLRRDTVVDIAGCTEQAGTRYVWCLAATQPATASGVVLFARATVSAGVIQTVEVLGPFDPLPAIPTLLAHLPTASLFNKGQLRYQVDGVRGLKVSNGLVWHAAGGHTANALDWGLVPTSTDTAVASENTVALQAAIDAVITAGGGSVYIPTGHYFFGNGTVTIDNGSAVSVFLVGDGPYASKIGKLSAATGHMLTMVNSGPPSGLMNLGIVEQTGGGAVGVGVLATGNGLFFENLWLNGHNQGIVLDSVGDAWLANILVESTTSTGFSFDGSGISCVNCEAFNTFTGFELANSAPLVASGIQLTNCRSVVPRGKGLIIGSTSNVDITNFQAFTDLSNGTPTVGIEINTSSHVRIIGGSLGGFDTYGIRLNTGVSTDVLIQGMTIRDIGTAANGTGIALNSGSVDVRILGNHITTTRRNGIEINSGSLIRIADNTFVNWGRQNTATANIGVALSGDAAPKGAVVADNLFIIDTRPSIDFGAGTVGDFFELRHNTELRSGAGQLYTLTNAPAAMPRPILFTNSAQATLNFGVPGAVPGTVTANITVPGAALGDSVSCGAFADAGVNYVFSCKVNVANVVTLVYTQVTGAAADPDGGGGAYTATVVRYAY